MVNALIISSIMNIENYKRREKKEVGPNFDLMFRLQ